MKPRELNSNQRPAPTAYRLSSGDAEDLRWYWLDAGGDLGMRSFSLAGGGFGGNGDTDPKAIRASERDRRIRETLRLLGALGVRIVKPADERRLQIFYAKDPKETWRGLGAFGPLAGLVPRSAEAKRLFREDTGAACRREDFERWLRALSGRVLGPAKLLRAGDVALVQRIVADCNAALALACRRYTEAAREHARLAEADRIGRLQACDRARAAWQAHKEATGTDG